MLHLTKISKNHKLAMTNPFGYFPMDNAWDAINDKEQGGSITGSS